MVATLILAPDIKGSRSWLVMGPIRIQSAEFMKVATALMLAYVCNSYGFKLNNSQSYSWVVGIVLLPMILIVLQKETGSALVFTAFFLALYREGFSGYILSFAFLAVVIFIAMLYSTNAVWGDTQVDKLTSYSIVSLSTLLMLAKQIKSKHRIHLQRLALFAVIAAILSFALSYFFVFDYSYVALVVMVVIMLYLLVLTLMYASRRYFFSLLLGICAFLFSLSVSFVYENILKPHQQQRIAVALGIKDDIKGAGYNVNQAKIAIGSGGLWGKGFMKGTQTKLNYVPEQDTDFIFCTIGEEYGFVGSGALLLLYLIFITRIFYLAEHQHTRFARVYGYCAASIFLFHVTINIGMVIGWVPVIGIPLPFLSYGGSSMWSFTILLFIFLKLDASRKLQKNSSSFTGNMKMEEGKKH